MSRLFETDPFSHAPLPHLRCTFCRTFVERGVLRVHVKQDGRPIGVGEQAVFGAGAKKGDLSSVATQLIEAFQQSVRPVTSNISTLGNAEDLPGRYGREVDIPLPPK